GLLGQRAVREDVHPDLSTTLGVTGHRDTRGFNLPVGHVPVLEGLDTEVTEGDLGTALGLALAAGVDVFAGLSAPGDEHGSGLRLGTGGGRCCRLGGCFGSRGCGLLRLAVTPTTSARAVAAVSAATGTTGRLGGLFAGEFLLGHVALVDPHLH